MRGCLGAQAAFGWVVLVEAVEFVAIAERAERGVAARVVEVPHDVEASGVVGACLLDEVDDLTEGGDGPPDGLVEALGSDATLAALAGSGEGFVLVVLAEVVDAFLAVAEGLVDGGVLVEAVLLGLPVLQPVGLLEGERRRPATRSSLRAEARATLLTKGCS